MYYLYVFYIVFLATYLLTGVVGAQERMACAHLLYPVLGVDAGSTASISLGGQSTSHQPVQVTDASSGSIAQLHTQV